MNSIPVFCSLAVACLGVIIYAIWSPNVVVSIIATCLASAVFVSVGVCVVAYMYSLGDEESTSSR